TGMIAMQGPKVIDLISNFSSEVPKLKRYRFTEKNLIFAKVMISRTGYTGEDGVEVILPAKFAGQAVKMMMGNLDPDQPVVKPAGLGARDSLRLEAAMALYGHEITESIDPLSAQLNFAIKLDKGDDNPEIGRFIGQDALQQIAKQGLRRKLIGLRLDGKRSARQDMKVQTSDGREVGVITSGCLSPTLGFPIAMAYVDMAHTEVGTTLRVDLGKSLTEA